MKRGRQSKPSVPSVQVLSLVSQGRVSIGYVNRYGQDGEERGQLVLFGARHGHSMGKGKER